MADNTVLHPSSTHREHLINLFCFKGHPVNNDTENEVVVLVNEGYVVGFSPKRLQPVWAAYRVAHAKRDVGYDRPHLYYDDTRLDPGHRIGAHTFGKHDNIAYNVGHMVPNEVINRQFGRLAQMETFFMSNMSPQRGSLNSGVWLKLETAIRNIKDTPEKDHVWAIAGPIFGDNPKKIKRKNQLRVPVPESYFYIMLDPFRYPWDRPSNVDVASFIIPQDAPRGGAFEDYRVNVADVEAATKLKFFPDWPALPPGAGLSTEEDEESFGTAETRHRLLRQLT